MPLTSPQILLSDNGSSRPQAVHRLRQLAQQLSHISGQTIHPVPLQHSDKIPPGQLGGQPAPSLKPHLEHALKQGQQRFHLIPLYIGPSRAISHYIPETLEQLRTQHRPIQLQIAPTLYPLPQGDPQLLDILTDHAKQAPEQAQQLLVDHGSPNPQVSAVRQHIAEHLSQRLKQPIHQAAMERRPGRDYDHSGSLLADKLEQLQQQHPQNPIHLTLLFLNPGTHAGPGGDIDQIIAAHQQRHPAHQISKSPLISEHPGLIPLLQTRLPNDSGSPLS